MASTHRRASDRGKSWERKVAKEMGDQRTGNRGTNTTDTTNEHWGVECKALDKLQLRETHLQQAITNAREKPWLLPMKEAGTGRAIVMMDYKKFIHVHLFLKEHGYYDTE